MARDYSKMDRAPALELRDQLQLALERKTPA